MLSGNCRRALKAPTDQDVADFAGVQAPLISESRILNVFKFVQKKNWRPDHLVADDWAELKKAWNKYNAAAAKRDHDKMERFAGKINRLEERLDVKKTDFSKNQSRHSDMTEL